MQFADHRVYTLLALAMMFGTMLLTRAVERSRFGMALLAIKQNEAAAEAAGINTLAWKMRADHAQRRHRRRGRRLLRGRAAGGDAAIGVRHAGLGAGADGRHVRRRRNGLGAGDRRGDPDPAGRDAARRSSARAFPASRAWSTASPSSSSSCSRPRACSGRCATSCASAPRRAGDGDRRPRRMSPTAAAANACRCGPSDPPGQAMSCSRCATCRAPSAA